MNNHTDEYHMKIVGVYLGLKIRALRNSWNSSHGD